MELGNKEASTYGCGTYRMFLILPEEEKSGRYLWRRFFPHTESISMENWPGKWGILTKNLYGPGHEPCFYVSGIRGCRDCHSSSRQKPYQIRNPGYSGFGISGPCKHTERTAGTRKRLCHCVLYLYHVWDSYGTCQNQDKRICYF